MKTLAILCLCGIFGKASSQTWAENAKATGEFNTLVGLLDYFNFTEALLDLGYDTTGFGPNDAVFAAANITFDSVLADPELSAAMPVILSYHAIPGKYMSSDVVSLLATSNGCIDVPTLLEVGGETMYVKIHLDVNAGTIKINDAEVIVELSDIEGSDGAAHAINSILDPETYTPCPMTFDNTSFVPKALATGKFNFLGEQLMAPEIQALIATNPQATLGGLTVFGPTDEAFADKNLLNATLLALLPALASHVLFERITLDDIKNITCKVFDTVSPLGAKIKIHQNGNMIMVNDAMLLEDLADFQGSDGIFHGINKVLGPFTPCVVPTAAPTPAPTAAAEPSAGSILHVSASIAAAVMGALFVAF